MCKVQSLLVVTLFVGLTHSWDIAVSAGNRLEFYTSDGVKTDTVHFNSQNLTALAYDEVHNVMLYVDKQSGDEGDAICAYNIASAEYKCYTQRDGIKIQGLIFDPITELVFFTDTNRRSINWFSFNPGFYNNNLGIFYFKLDDGIPSDIAIDSCRGYIYWINRKRTSSTIERLQSDNYNRHLEREVVINTTELDLHGLTICQQTNKMYWVMPENGLKNHLYSADLDGNNKVLLADLTSKAGDIQPFVYPNILSVSNKHVFYVDWCITCNSKRIWKLQKPIRYYIHNYKLVSHIQTDSVVGIASNYKVKDRFQGISECYQVPHNYEKNETNDSFKVAREYEGSFCDYGIKVRGESFCKCIPGYTGARCDVSVCGNYCLKGYCSINEEGHPACRCIAGYSGKRCEVNVCQGHCSNNGICSLNWESQPVCQCKGNYLGARCEVSACENYCLQGSCSVNEERHPACRCIAGYSGERCEVNVCQGHCSNNGTCSLNAESQPVCQCKGNYLGARCEVSACENYCLQGSCSVNEEGHPACRCNAGYSGERCEVKECHEYCLNNGICSLNEEDEAVCECVGEYEGQRCDVPLNNREGSLDVEPVYQCNESQNNLLEENEGNLTLNDLLTNWRKHTH